MTTHEVITQSIASRLKPPFRGGVLENCRYAPMGKGHKNDGRPFDIETARYLKPVFDAIDDPDTRKVVIKAGVKTMKTFAVEASCAWHVCHDIGDANLYFGTGEIADDQAKTRFNSWVSGISHFQEKLETITNRFDKNTSLVTFPDKSMRLLPANLSSTQGFNLCFVGVCDAFLTGATGMIDQAIARTTQYPHDKKIIIESQGGEEGFDFDRHYDDTDQRELHVNCPCCGTSHIFNWKAFEMARDESFEAVLPFKDRTGTDEEQEAARIELTKLLKTPERYRCGFMRGPDSEIKNANGTYNQQAVIECTHFECYHCGEKWFDDGEFGSLRMALDMSAHYVSAHCHALPGEVGFNIPQWINRRIPWGRDVMLKKLKAQRTADELGNFEPLKQWWQKVAARTWDKDLTSKPPERIAASIYDDNEPVEGELCRISSTDIQFNLTHMIYQSWSIGSGVPPRLLHYEWVKPPAGLETDADKREWCKNRVRKLDEQFGVQPQNSMKDCAHRPDLVREWAAEDHVVGHIKVGGRLQKKLITYGLLMGDEKVSYRWHHPGRKHTLERFSRKETVLVDIVKDGRRLRVPVQHRLWSKPSIADIAARWRDGDNAPKMEIHSRFLQDTSKEGLWAQLNSERLVPWKGRPGKMRWDNEGRPNHAWDGWCMVVVRMDELQLLTHFGAPEEEEES